MSFEDKKLELGLIVAGILIAGVGVFIWKSGNIQQVEVLSAETTATNSAEIVVNVSGAVNSPGVYRFSENTRLEEALRVAGGLSSEADVNWVDANVNLAEKMADGQKVYIPKVSSQSSVVSGQEDVNTPGTIKISINSAGVNELDTLPGIGPVTAQKIVASRPYQRIEELLTRKIVGQKVYGDIKDKVTLW